MKAIIIQELVGKDADLTTFSDGIKITVRDLAAGKFLAIEGVNVDPALPEENAHEFYFESEDDIDFFCAECKRLLNG